MSDSAEYEKFIETSNKKSFKVDKYCVEYYDTGPEEISCPIICLPPSACDATIYYKIQKLLSDDGYRIISINYPETYSVKAFCEVFAQFLSSLHIEDVHLIGSSLGGLLAQKFFELSQGLECCVRSLILCNTFVDTYSFGSRFSARLFWMLPSSFLRMTFEYPPIPRNADEGLEWSMELAKKQTDNMTQGQLASRLTMACATAVVDTEALQQADITIIEVGDLQSTYKKHYDTVRQSYPLAKLASLDSGGHFPFVSRHDEFAAYIKMHFEAYMDTPFFPGIAEDGN